MKHALLATTTAAVLAAASAAHAQADWTGAYVGGHLGYAFRDDDSDIIVFDQNLDGVFGDTVVTPATTAERNAFAPGFCNGAPRGPSAATACDDEDDERGGQFGVRAGYDQQFGNWVVGALVEYDSVELQDNVTAFSITPASYTFTRELDWVAAVRLRGGYAMGRYLGYVTAGVATGRLENSFSTSNTANSFTMTGGDDEANGYQAGFGLEAQVTPRVTVGLEYLYTDLEHENDVTVRAGGPAPVTNPFILLNPAGTDLRPTSQDFDYDAVRLTVSYRF